MTKIKKLVKKYLKCLFMFELNFFLLNYRINMVGSAKWMKNLVGIAGKTTNIIKTKCVLKKSKSLKGACR